MELLCVNVFFEVGEWRIDKVDRFGIYFWILVIVFLYKNVVKFEFEDYKLLENVVWSFGWFECKIKVLIYYKLVR